MTRQALHPGPSRCRRPPGTGSDSGRVIACIASAAAVAVGVPFLFGWVGYRRSHSLTEDVFVEAHIVNVAPQTVSGRIIRILADENDRVEQGQLVAEIDPAPYRDARSNESARAGSRPPGPTSPGKRPTSPGCRTEVPIRVEIARRGARSHRPSRPHPVRTGGWRLTQDEVETGIDEARAAVKAARADLTLAHEEYSRFTSLYQQDASGPAAGPGGEHDPATPPWAPSTWPRPPPGQGLPRRADPDRGRRGDPGGSPDEGTEDPPRTSPCPETGYDDIPVSELMAEVKRRAVDEARRGAGDRRRAT